MTRSHIQKIHHASAFMYHDIVDRIWLIQTHLIADETTRSSIVCFACMCGAITSAPWGDQIVNALFFK